MEPNEEQDSCQTLMSDSVPEDDVASQSPDVKSEPISEDRKCMDYSNDKPGQFPSPLKSEPAETRTESGINGSDTPEDLTTGPRSSTVDDLGSDKVLVPPVQECPVQSLAHGAAGLVSETSGDQNKATLDCKAESLSSPRRRRRRGKRPVYDKDDDPETIKEKKQKRAVELKLKNLKWTLNQESEVTGKRQKKAPERFELSVISRRRSCMDEIEGDGDPLGSIPWIVQHIRDANIYTLRLLHRIMFRKQGMFSEKHIRRSVLGFRGFPFDFSSAEIQKRKIPLEKASVSSLARLCDMLGVRCGEKHEMINNMLKFLHRPSKQQVEDFLRDRTTKEGLAMVPNMMQNVPDARDVPQFYVPVMPTAAHSLPHVTPPSPVTVHPNMNHVNYECLSEPPLAEGCELYSADDAAVVNSPWKKPPFFIEGTGIKLKFFKPIVANIQVATNSFIELLHRLLFLNLDEKANMRRNILEFSGFRCRAGSEEYFCRVKLLSVLPFDQVKYLCRVLCLPAWSRSRQLLIDSILNFLLFPCLSAMKKTVPSMPNDAKNTNNAMDICKRLQTSELEIKPLDSEEIEIVPDIHIPEMDEDGAASDKNSPQAQINSEVKLKNFPNIHYQIISTPAAKLNDLHMILYFKPCPLNVVRKNILEFTHFPFSDTSPEYQCRRTLLERMSLESLKTVITVLCLKQYVVDLSKCNIVEAVLRFLLKPSALLNSCTSFSSPTPVHHKEPAASELPYSGKYLSLSNLINEYRTQDDKLNLEFPCSTGEITIKPINLVTPVPVVKEEPKSKLMTIPVTSTTSTVANPPASVAPLNLATNKTSLQTHPAPAQKSVTTNTTPPPPPALNGEENRNPVPVVSENGVNNNNSNNNSNYKPPPVPSPVKDGANRRKSQQPVKIQTKSQYVPMCEMDQRKSSCPDLDESLAKVRRTAHIFRATDRCVDSDENDDEPLSKFIGHPSDDQLYVLINKIIKESRLEEITMKQVIKMVFSAYPNFNLTYRREFIKSVVRQILSQMDEHRCSVSTTVFTF